MAEPSTTAPPAPASATRPGLAVTGLGCHAGPIRDLYELEHAIYHGRPRFSRPAEEYPDLADAARQALHDGGVPAAQHATVPVVVLSDRPVPGRAADELAVGCGSDPVVFAEDCADLVPALDTVGRWLAEGTARAALICATDPAGAVAMLVARGDTHRGPAYATLDALARQPVGTGATGTAARAALDTTRTGPAKVGHLTLCAADGAADLADLAQVWSQASVGARHTALTDLDRPASFGLVTALVEAALCLHHCYLPASPTPTGARPDPPPATGLAVAYRSHPWLHGSPSTPRRSMVSGRVRDGQLCLVLSGATIRGELVQVDWRRTTELVLLPIGGRNTTDLLRAITHTRDAMRAGANLPELAGNAVRDLPDAALRVVFCATPESLPAELERALTSLPSAHAEAKDWASPTGSYCAAHPIGPDGAVTLVFPGILSAYPDLGRDACRFFPGLAPWSSSLIGHYDHWASGLFYRALGPHPTPADLAAWEDELFASFADLSLAGMFFGQVYAELFRRLVRPRSYGALGYSLGEVTMLLATGQWPGGAGYGDDVVSVPLLAGGERAARQLVRERWCVPDNVPDHAVWGSRMLFADAVAVQSRAAGYDRVFVSHINTPNEVMVAGDPAQCEALAAELGCPSIASASSHVLHTPLTGPDQFGEPFRRAVTPPPGVELFSTRRYRPIGAATAQEMSDDLTEVVRRPIDFPRLVRAAYLRGYRYFVEVGPGGLCTRWVQDILAGRPHVAESLDRRGVSTATSVVRLLAKLVSHGVPVELNPFLPGRYVPTPLNSATRFPGSRPPPTRTAPPVPAEAVRQEVT